MFSIIHLQLVSLEASRISLLEKTIGSFCIFLCRYAEICTDIRLEAEKFGAVVSIEAQFNAVRSTAAAQLNGTQFSSGCCQIFMVTSRGSPRGRRWCWRRERWRSEQRAACACRCRDMPLPSIASTFCHFVLPFAMPGLQVLSRSPTPLQRNPRYAMELDQEPADILIISNVLPDQTSTDVLCGVS